MNFSTENTTHEEAVRLLNDRETKNIDLYNSLGATQKQNSHVISLLFDIWKDAIEGEIAQNLRQNPFSIPSVKAIDKFFDAAKR
jgi:hypothetical protein